MTQTGPADGPDPASPVTPRLARRPLLVNHPVAARVAAVLLVVGALLFLALAFPTTARWVQAIDDVVYRLAVDLEWAPLVAVSEVLDFVGSTWVTLPLIVAVAAFLAWRTRWEALITWLVAMGLSQLLIGPVKDLYERPRPPLPLVETSGYSFPSGHAVATGAIAVSMAIVLVPAGQRRRNLEVLAILVVVAMATSRVYLRAHWLSDALAGAVMGAGIAVAVAAVVHTIDERRERSLGVDGRDHELGR